MKTRLWLAALGLLVTAGPLPAQTLEVHGEVRPRFEARDPVAGLPSGEELNTFTSMRARASVLASLGRDVRAFVQFQDVRVWGTEASTVDPSAEALDLHQGWIELGDPEAGDWALRLGRQEIAYGGERIIGALNWVQQARSFDGARLRVRPAEDLWLDGIAMTIGNADLGGPRDEALYGLYSRLPAQGDLDAYFLYNTYDEAPAVGEPADLTDQYTAGARWASRTGAITWRVEGAYQFGERLGSDVSAYLLALRAGTAVGDKLRVNAWYDRLSGDDDAADGEIRVFDTLFATNHKFYGFMDLFLNIPVQTNGRGLQDAALKTTYALQDDITLIGDLHAFFLTATDGLDSGHIGEEVDLGFRWAYTQGVGVTGGLSYFVAGDAWSDALGRADENQLWGYVMIDVLF